MSLSDTPDPLSQTSLSELHLLCQKAVDEYSRSRNNKTDSSSCVEILRRAARGENEAIGVILLISRPFIEKKCPPDLRAHSEDIIQNVNLRLFKKFRNQKNPFQVTTFPRYRVYLNAVIANVIYNIRENNPAIVSLDQLAEAIGVEPEQPDRSQEIENLMLFQQLLELLDDPLEREIIRRRYGKGEKSANIAEALELDLKKVYRIADRAIRRLKEETASFWVEIQLSATTETLPIGGELEITITLKPTTSTQNADNQLTIPANEVEENELNLTLDAPGFQFLEEPVASFPFMQPSDVSATQRATFRLVALRPGAAQITVELYRGDVYEGQIKREVTIRGISEQATLKRQIRQTYQVQLFLSAEVLPIGGELEVTIDLKPATFAEQADYLLHIPTNEIKGSELNLTLDAPGFQFLEEAVASLPFMEPSRLRAPQRATFRLVALRPGAAQITVELYRGDVYEGQIKRKVTIRGISEQAMGADRLALGSRPVAQPDYILQVHTHRDEIGKSCSFHYHLTSSHPALMLRSGVSADSAVLSMQQLDMLRESWQEVLRETRGGLSTDARSRLVALGRYLYRRLVPEGLRDELRGLGRVGRTLLLITDQDAWLPWELLYDDKRRRFLGERVIMGRWLRELGDVPPYEFPVGQVSVAYYEKVAQDHEWWAGLIEPRGSPRAESLPGGMLESLVVSESIRGLHLLRYGRKVGEESDWEAPVRFANLNQEHTIEGEVRPIKLNLRRHRPLVQLSYVGTSRELTDVSQKWASTFVRAGCSAFVGTLWTVPAEVEVAFISGFYHHLWTGASLGEAFEAGRQLARAVVPESFDWLAYVLFGDPMARPYRPVKGPGYAVLEVVGQSVDEPLRAGILYRCRVSLRRTPPVWLKERVIEVEEALAYQNARVHLVAFDLQVTPSGPIELLRTPQGDYLGWFSMVAAPEMVGESVELQVHFADGREPIESLMLSFDVIS